MSRLNQSQVIIFTATGLAISLLANVLFAVDQSNLTATIAEKTAAIAQLETDLAESKTFKTEQLSRIESMSGNQRELGEVIGELQSEIAKLNYQYLQTKDTAQLSMNNLEKAQSQIAFLKSEIEAKTQQLENAQITVFNQQRALKAQLNTESRNPQITLAAESFAKSLPTFGGDLSITQSSSDQAIINIPLSRLFKTGTLDFSMSATSILDSIAAQLAEFPSLNIQVIGHSDARPIVSKLAEKYPTNWELSSVRASKIVSYLADHQIAQERLTASGKAANEPVRESLESEDLELNRRIEIRLY